MLHQLTGLSASSRFDFSNSNYNYDNTNTTVSSHLSFIRNINPAHMAKNHVSKKSVGTDGKTTF